jgi:CBS domain-containing protein
MLVREGMTDVLLTVGPEHTLREAAAAMWERRVGAAVVLDPDAHAPSVITERDILHSIGIGQNPDQERVADHLTASLTFAAPDWSLEQAAATMVRGGFRHLIVVEHGDLAGMPSMRDIVRVWSGDGASCEVPSAAAGAQG